MENVLCPQFVFSWNCSLRSTNFCLICHIISNKIDIKKRLSYAREFGIIEQMLESFTFKKFLKKQVSVHILDMKIWHPNEEYIWKNFEDKTQNILEV